MHTPPPLPTTPPAPSPRSGGRTRITLTCLAAAVFAFGCGGGGSEESTKGPYFAVEGVTTVGGLSFTACIEGIEFLDPASARGAQIAANLAAYYLFVGSYRSFAGEGQTCRERFPTLGALLSVDDYNKTVLPAVVVSPPPPAPSPAPPPAPAPAPVDPLIQNIVPTTVTYGSETSGAKRAVLKGGGLTLAGAKEPDGSQELILSSSSSTLRVITHATNGTTVATDSASQIKLVSETGPKGTVVRAYGAAGEFVTGYFIEVKSSTLKYLWRLKADGSTEPGNLKDGRIFSPSDTFRPKGAAADRAATLASRARPLADTGGCHEFISGITSSTSDAAADIGDALDHDGETSESAKRAGRAAQFLSSLWRRIPQMCADAPDPLSDAEFQRETVIESIHAIDDGRVGDLAGKYLDYADFLKEVKQSAANLRNAVAKLPEALRNLTGSSSVDATGFQGVDYSQQLNAAVTAGAQPAAPAKVYISDSLNCVRGRSVAGVGGGNYEFSNSCSSISKVAWCFSSGALCSLSSQTLLSVGQTYSTAFPSSLNTIYWAACPSIYEGKDVQLSNGPTAGTFYCSYWSR
jgi:hypothetical protein